MSLVEEKPYYSPIQIGENDYNPYTNIPEEKKEQNDEQEEDLFGWI